MTELSFAELDALDRIKAREESRMIFFQQVKGLKWFDSFYGQWVLQCRPKPSSGGNDRQGTCADPLLVCLRLS